MLICYKYYINNLIYLISNAEIKKIDRNESNINFNYVTKIPSYKIYFNDKHDFLIQSKTMLAIITNENIKLITGKENYISNFFDKLEEYKASRYGDKQKLLKRNKIELIGETSIEDNGQCYDHLEYIECTDHRKNISLQEYLDYHKNDKLKITIEVIK